MRNRLAHVFVQAARAQEPLRTALELTAGVDQHARLHIVGDLVVERLDRVPQRHHAEDLAAHQIGANDLVGARAGRLAEPVHEGAADPVDHAVGHVRRDDLALQRMARHVGRKAIVQRLREVALERGRDPRVVGQRRREQLVVEPNLAIGQQHRALGTGKPEPFGAPLGDRFVGRQKFDRAIQAACLFQILHEARLRIEQLRRDAARHRQHLGLEDVVAQNQ